MVSVGVTSPFVQVAALKGEEMGRLKDLKETLSDIKRSVLLAREFEKDMPEFLKKMEKAKRASQPVAVQAAALEAAINRFNIDRLNRVISIFHEFDDLSESDRNIVFGIVMEKEKR